MKLLQTDGDALTRFSSARECRHERQRCVSGLSDRGFRRRCDSVELMYEVVRGGLGRSCYVGRSVVILQYRPPCLPCAPPSSRNCLQPSSSPRLQRRRPRRRRRRSTACAGMNGIVFVGLGCRWRRVTMRCDVERREARFA